ncbi:hypothetical protein M407DRAFT_31158 [Tulasnella calospora MUT 4182]|uniref:Uncharacterized protein n=1 Tax=Tulasnella calospora MUT 4182 TaxID=1051891 RepID=A0A0C3PW38_9AGAM|nr:hypothetical protein M407DRAFT_31158 [Tulasnella calospora MUT 4182]
MADLITPGICEQVTPTSWPTTPLCASESMIFESVTPRALAATQSSVISSR